MGKPFAQAKGEVAKCASGFRWFAEHAEATARRRGGAGRRLAGPGHLPAARRRARHHAVELPALAGDPVRRPGGDGGQRRPARSTRRACPAPRSLLEDLFRRAGAPDGVLQTLLDRHRPGAGDHRRPPGGRGDPDRQRRCRPGRRRAGRRGRQEDRARARRERSRSSCCRRPTSTGPSPSGSQARVQNAGQSCIAAKRFIVHRDGGRRVHRAVRRRHGAHCPSAIRSTRPPRSGRWSPRPPVDTIAAQVEDARAKGATILCGGERVVGPGGPDRPGYFYRPTVITGITPGMRVATEEVFGPVALLFVVGRRRRGTGSWPTGPSSASARACGPRDPDEQQRFVDRAAGRPGLRQRDGRSRCPSCPSAAIKSSGIGRELAAPGLHEFCNVKSVWMA